MSKFALKHRDALEKLANTAESDKLRSSASELAQSFEIIIEGLRISNSGAWDPENEETLKDPMGRIVMTPEERALERKADDFVRALDEDPEFSTKSFRCIKDFHTCRDSEKYHIAWCIAALLVAVAETVIPLAGGGK